MSDYIFLAISIALAAAAGVFSRGKVLGPSRLELDESPMPLLRITGIGLLAYVFIAAFGSVYLTRNGESNITEDQKVILSSLCDLGVLGAILVATWIVRPNGLRRMGINSARIPAALAGGLLGIAILLPLVFVVEDWTEKLWIYLHYAHPDAHEFLLVLQNDRSHWMHDAVVISASLLAPLAEEMFFRGCVQTFLRYMLNSPWPAIAITSLLFAAIHPHWTAPPIFVLALGLGYAYERTGNLWLSIAIHSFFNLASIGFFLWHPSM